jgi:hypothetical protein
MKLQVPYFTGRETDLGEVIRSGSQDNKDEICIHIIVVPDSLYKFLEYH